jgi:hypothetical protein
MNLRASVPEAAASRREEGSKVRKFSPTLPAEERRSMRAEELRANPGGPVSFSSAPLLLLNYRFIREIVGWKSR